MWSEKSNTMAQRLQYRRQALSPAQNAVLNPVDFSSERAQVISMAKSGLHKNYKEIDVCSCTVETTEHPGHPMQLTGLASIAKLIDGLKVGDWVEFDGTIQGSLSRGRSPYIVVTNLEKLPATEEPEQN